MRFVCDSCRAQYMISDEKVGAKGVKVRCKKCGFVILVRRAQDVAPPPPAPVDEGADATQVMQIPLPNGGAAPPDPDITNPGVIPGPLKSDPNNLLAGVADDEIGAVFDSVLQSGSHKIPAGAEAAAQAGQGQSLGESPDDRMSTRVLDLETVKRLADEAAADGGAAQTGAASNGVHANGKNGAAKSEAPKHDWFVAVDEKQVGPLTLEKVKERWEQGEIGPDSLCWRAGFSDWLPLSEVAELASVLAPEPKKPVIVASAQVEPHAGAVVTMPVESAFSAGGVTRTVRSDVPVMTATPAAGEDTGWKPSAASALASLVKEEIEALAKPAAPVKKAEAPAASPAAAPSAEAKKPQVKGLLDLPSAEHSIPQDVLGGHAGHAPSSSSAPMLTPAQDRRPSSAPQAQHYGPTPYATSIYRTPSSRANNKVLYAVGGVIVFLLLALMGVVAHLALRDDPSRPAEVAQAPAALPSEAIARAAEAPAAPEAAAPAEEKKSDPAPSAAEEKAAKAAPPQEREAPKKVARAEPARRESPRPSTRSEPAPRRDPPPQREERSAPAPSSAPDEISDDFDKMFGGGGDSAPKKTTQPAGGTRPKKDVWIPPAPGSGSDVPDKLGTSDIMQVVVSNKGAIQNCVNQQKAKDPGASGRLVMRWTIRTTGSTSNVSVRSPEFKNTYVASCLGGLIKRWKFPRHKSQGEPVDFPFVF